MKKIKHFIPGYAYLPIIALFACTNIVYFIPKIAYDPSRTYDFALGIDKAIPFVPVFILFYVLAYAQWVFGYIVIARDSRETTYKVATIDILAKLFCGIIFIALPTVMIRPEITGGDFFNRLTDWIYQADTPAINLLPSLHCLESWAVFRFSLKLKLPIGYKIAMGIMTFAVFLSVLFVKQHIIIDIPAGILVFELAYLIVHFTKLDQTITNSFKRKTKTSC